MTPQEELEIYKAKFYMLENKLEATKNEYEEKIRKLLDLYNKNVDDYNDLVDKSDSIIENHNTLCKQIKILEADNEKYRYLYKAARNKLEYNEIYFNEYETLQAMYGEPEEDTDNNDPESYINDPNVVLPYNELQKTKINNQNAIIL